MAEDKKKEIAVIEITEEYMKDRLYEFRGKKVMLDSDLAEIYGYETKNFKRQVKNNIAKFVGDDFMFELNDEEVENLSRCKNFTLNVGRGSNIKYKPYVFTEQGVYMLMTVLRGELAIKQSRALVKTFKKMKDYILENRDIIGQREILQLSRESANNRIEINKINSDMISLEKQISDVAEGLKDVVTKSELADMMNSFVSDDEKWLMFHRTKAITALTIRFFIDIPPFVIKARSRRDIPTGNGGTPVSDAFLFSFCSLTRSFRIFNKPCAKYSCSCMNR